MRIGLFGGTFDPVHYGHLLLAEQCREQCELDEVWFLPSGNPPHKRGEGISPGKARAEMLEFAVAGLPEFRVDRMELERAGTTFTVDTLEELHRQDASRALFFLIGADSLADLPTWREPRRVAELATIVAVNRGDRPLPDPAALAATLGESLASRIRFVTMPGIDLSSTDIRRRVRAGESIRFMMPRAVEAYIREHGLYRE
ncbi:MAG: nicotinate-nucleotide adenylyltransferase [Planctomycetaceae bacterium]